MREGVKTVCGSCFFFFFQIIKKLIFIVLFLLYVPDTFHLPKTLPPKPKELLKYFIHFSFLLII